MRAFSYTRARDASDAVACFRPGTAYLGGGTNLVDLMRLGVAAPDQLVDVSRLNPMGAKGLGEIGITGTAAAIGNAVYHATGRRIRDVPLPA